MQVPLPLSNGSAEKTEDMDTTDSNLQPEDEKQDDATQDENGVEEICITLKLTLDSGP